jgi:cytochrome c peroxidase
MWRKRRVLVWGIGLLLAAWPVLVANQAGGGGKQQAGKSLSYAEDLDWQIPNEKLMLPFKDQQPIYFVNGTQSPAEWRKLPKFWNEATEQAQDPRTGDVVVRKVVKIKVPLGLNQSPPVPAENAMTVARWQLGKRLYFDHILSSDGTVACASCHDPRRGWTDQSPVSVGIGGLKGGVSAPTVLNACYNPLQFWDGRATSLEDQAQGPVANPVEMFSGKGHAWRGAVERVRKKADYVQRFREAYGTDPTRDAIAKAIATFERTVLSGNSLHDRAELAMCRRVSEAESTDFTIQAVDYEKVLRETFAAKDLPALTALKLAPARDGKRIPEVARALANGRVLFFGKARCATCHVGDLFTDNQFHNLGVGVKNGRLPADGLGRFARVPLGHKNSEFMGAFKTPTLRGLGETGPYMHDGSEKTLEEVIEFYDRGGNANEFLSAKMRDVSAEQAYEVARQRGTKYSGPKPTLLGTGGRPIIPLKLNLSKAEKADLVMFVRALHGDPVDPIVSEPRFKAPRASARR